MADLMIIAIKWFHDTTLLAFVIMVQLGYVII